MAKFAKETKRVGEIAAQRDMAWNFIALSSWRVRDNVSNMEFTSTVDATILYDQTIYTAAVMSRENGLCVDDLRIYGKVESPFFKLYLPVNYTEDIYLDVYREEKPPLPIPCPDHIPASMIPSYTQWAIRYFLIIIIITY